MRYLTRALTSIVLASFSVNSWAFRPGDGGRGYRQELLHPNLGFPTSYHDGLFTPFEDLSTLSETDFTTLTHPAFPRHSVRIKQTKFCDNTVRAYTGYIDIGPRHLFFYFFESRSRPDKDPVVLWTNGGPGCSSSLGLFMELGPCRVTDANTTTFHKESWNNNANIFFIDQPIGVGFSYADYGEAVGTSEEAAGDIGGFVRVFFEHFSEFRGRPFHLAGESYAGRYLPIFAAYIYDQNVELKKHGLAPINLTSVMIGNGYTHPNTMVESYYDMACTVTEARGPPVLGVRECVRMKQAQIRCKKWMEKACMEPTFDELGCAAAASFCQVELGAPLIASGKNPYDLSRECDGTIEDTLCYPISKKISAYLDKPDVRKLIGVDPSLKNRNFSSCSGKVSNDFVMRLDPLHSTDHYVAALLEHGIKVLIYVGVNDWICNYIGNSRWVSDLDWSGREGYEKAVTRDWYTSASFTESSLKRKLVKAGTVREYGGLTFLTIDGAGHMAPYDKPEELLDMASRWLDGRKFT